MGTVKASAKMISPAAVRVGARLQMLVDKKTPLLQRPVMIGGRDTGMPQKMFDISWRVKSFQGYSSPGPVLFGIDLEPVGTGHEIGIKRTPQVSECLEGLLADIKDGSALNLMRLMDFSGSELTGETELFPLFWSGNYSDKGSTAFELFGKRYDCVIGLSTGAAIDFDEGNYLRIPYIGNILGRNFYDLLMAQYTPRKSADGPELTGFSMFVVKDNQIKIGANTRESGSGATQRIQEYALRRLSGECRGFFRNYDCQVEPDTKGFDVLLDCRLDPAK